MTTKKKENDTNPRQQENFDQLYTAHQVHTLAQLLYHQLSAGWQHQQHQQQQQQQTFFYWYP